MIKVVIERLVVEGLETPYESAIANLLDVMVKAPGYVSGESFGDINQPNHYVVVSNWNNEHSWDKWFNSQARKGLLDAINPFLQYPERCSVLSPSRFISEAKTA
ncbi:hypothetical protein A9Q99_20860 [Gammaproteobacteria bacterium 45_16_T64]|nr:hypothetical protein A9Q99_20860 [Gammaproteobacteria bacterium 45_16_T64]